MKNRRTPPKRGTTRPLFTEAQLRAGGTGAGTKDEGRKDDAMTTTTKNATTLEPGPIPAACPCGLAIAPKQLDRLREAGRPTFACPVCSRRWALAIPRDLINAPGPSDPTGSVRAALVEERMGKADVKVEDARKLLGGAATKVPGTRANRGPGAASTPPQGNLAPGKVDLGKDTCLLAVELHLLGDTRKVRESEATVDATAGDNPERAVVKVNKKLYDTKLYQNVTSIDGQIRAFMDASALPRTSFLARGSYRVPFVRLESVYDRLEEFARERLAAVRAFVGGYPEVVAEARTKLGGLFNPAQFPGARLRDEQLTVEGDYERVLWDAFGGTTVEEMIGIRPYMNVTPGQVESFSKRLYDRAARDARSAAEADVREIRDGLRVAFATIVEQLVERVRAKSADGSARFVGSNLTNVQEFIASFGAMNVAQDGQLAGLVEKAKGILSGIDQKDVSEEKTVREAITSGLAAVQVEIAALGVAPRPKRAVRIAGLTEE